MTRYMYDSVDPATIPANATMVAGYVDGLYANMGEMAARFPHAIRVGIAVRWTTRAQVLDVENGDATPAQAVDWCAQTMHDVPNDHLTVYCDTSTWPAVRAAFRANGVTEPNYWVAQYDGVATIPPGSIGKQYADHPGYDVSVVADYWPGIDPAPAPTPAPTPTPVEDDMPSFTIDAKGGGKTFARGRYTNVSFFADNTLAGAAPAKLRVVIWASGKAPEIHEVAVSNSGGNQTTLMFTDAALTHSVTVTREDSGAFPVYVEVS